MKKLYKMILLGLFLISLTGCRESIPPDGANTVDLTGTVMPPGTEQHTDPHLDNFREVLGDGDFCAVSHLGYLDGSYDEILSHVEDLGVLEAFPFLEIPKENCVSLEGGELYAVVPADADAVITVYSAVLDEENYTVQADQQLAQFTDGSPILLKCNVSEIMPNVILEITVKGQKHTYSPTLSGENGKLVQTEGVYDFSPYDVLFAGIADGAE